ncbi:MAG: hypothetical protein NTU80_06690 [Verrucomicrobia bacterium]|nr:hypothetical protein [Verrucomicrobiota bacterium]
MLPASALPQVHYAEEPAGVEALWHDLARRETASPKLWMDAYLAAFALRQNTPLITLDQAFHQFEPQGLLLTLLTSVRP